MVDDLPRLPGRTFPIPASVEVPRALRARGAFLPDPLPSQVTLRQKTLRDAADAQEAVARLDTRMRGMPAEKEWVYQVFRREMRASALLDGVMIASRQALLADARADTGQDEAVRLFLGYVRAGVEMAEVAHDHRRLTPDLLGRLSAGMFGDDVGDGLRWRTEHHWLSGPELDGAYVIVAPPGPEMWVATEQWCTWMCAQNEMLVLVKVALAFVHFLLLSPFPGSTHLGRLMIGHELMVTGVLSEPVLPISEWLYRHRQQFSSVLQGVVDRGDLDALVGFLADGVRKVCREEEVRVAAVWARGETLRRHYNRQTSIGNLAEALAYRPVMNLRQISEVCGVSLSQAATLARQLQDDGFAQSLDPDTLGGHDDDVYRRIIFVPETLGAVLDIFPSF